MIYLPALTDEDILAEDCAWWYFRSLPAYKDEYKLELVAMGYQAISPILTAARRAKYDPECDDWRERLASIMRHFAENYVMSTEMLDRFRGLLEREKEGNKDENE